MTLNPNSARASVDAYVTKSDVEKSRFYPQFFKGVELKTFRHIHNLTLDFVHPISVVSGSNRSGKTSALMAIACSHYNFDRPDVVNGSWKRATWSHLVRFTNHDVQAEDWGYYVMYREGNVDKRVRGYRNHLSKKWGGAGKKEGQIGKSTPNHPGGGRHVCLIDLNRITPGRHLSSSAYAKARDAVVVVIDDKKAINEYLSYILEDNYDVNKLSEIADNKVFQFDVAGKSHYSSFNTASGEDVLVNLLSQILHMPDYSLVLIDELEVGLHPKIQRRLMDVIYMISEKQHKQFIITSHSYAIIDCVPKESRLFVETANGNSLCLCQLSTYETLTRMDSKAFPVVTFYVEDELSMKIVGKAINELNVVNAGFARMSKVVVAGSASKTYAYFKMRKKLLSEETIMPKAACVLDGDMRNKKDSNGDLLYPLEDGLFFHHSEYAPEKMLLMCYLANHPSAQLSYHAEHSNPHCLLEKMVEQGLAQDKDDAFEKCFNYYKNSVDGSVHFEELKKFIEDNCRN